MLSFVAFSTRHAKQRILGCGKGTGNGFLYTATKDLVKDPGMMTSMLEHSVEGEYAIVINGHSLVCSFVRMGPWKVQIDMEMHF